MRSTGLITGARRTAILATYAVAVTLLARQIVAGKILHGGVGINEILNRWHWERGLTAALKLKTNKIYTTNAEKEKTGGGVVEEEDEDKDEYKYEDDYYC